jgi:hypothetical protein
MQGNTAKAKSAYQEFLTLWMDADPDIPTSKKRKRSTQNYNKRLATVERAGATARA